MEFLLTPASVLLLFAFFFIGSVGAVFIERLFSDNGKMAGFWGHGFALLGSLLGLAISVSVLFFGQGIAFTLPTVFPNFLLDFRLDGIAAFFFGIISLVSALASIYGFGYQKHFYGKYRLGVFSFFYNAFIASLLLVPIANHALFFLLAWELMSVASYFLVVFENQKEENIKAGFLYFLMTHFGTVFVMIAFFLAYKATGSFLFDDWRAATGTITPLIQGIIFGAALIGFGTKAGIIPLHIWLPEAHPAAPSHVSALMSGVMVKTALFMLFRFFFDFFPGAPMEWGLVIILIGSLSALLGILYALSENDIKRLLAFSTVENVGIILLGLGAGVTFFSIGLESFALFSLAAALYHTLNHAIFKSLLFLGAGSVVEATGTRNMESYGGLIKLLPFTAGFFLVGSLAISAFPPFNGFASEWLTFQSLFIGMTSAEMIIKVVFFIAIGSLVFTSGLAAACFVKTFGATFLARPRTEEAKNAKEVSVFMLLPMGILALLSFLLGINATTVVASLIAIIASIGLIRPVTLQFPFSEFIQARADFAAILPLESIAFLLGLVFLLSFGAIWFVTRSRKIVVGPTWDCGTPLGPRGEITSGSFSRSLVTIFRGILRPTRQSTVEYHDEDMRYFIKSQEIRTSMSDPYRKGIYQPIGVVLHFLASQARRIQSGNVNMYILYLFLTLIILLLWATHV
ncbi:MAG: proton-conducting transporter membrane subunit [Patescibacteria group bacterium]